MKAPHVYEIEQNGASIVEVGTHSGSPHICKQQGIIISSLKTTHFLILFMWHHDNWRPQRWSNVSKFSYGKHVPQYNHYSIFLSPHFDFFLLHHLCQFNHYYKVYLNFLVEVVHLSQINFKQAFKCLNHIFKTNPSSEDSHHLFPGPSWIRTCCHFTKHVWHVLNCDSIGMGNDLFLRWGISHSPPHHHQPH